MLDLTAEVVRSQVVPLATITATANGMGVDVSNTNTGDILALTQNAKNVTGTTPSATCQLQDSADNSSGWANVATTALMPATAFPAVTASLANPVVLPLDPRALRRYIRIVTTITGTTPSFDLNIDLLRRPLQVGFNTNSG